MWIYEQATGKLTREGKLVATGYAGRGDGKNNPAMQHVRNTGPIPRGKYTIGPPRDTKDHGPHVLPLTPDQTNEMFGRSAFLIHGDSVKLPGTASQGCIILARAMREKISSSGDVSLRVA